jgi:hypothetical protein
MEVNKRYRSCRLKTARATAITNEAGLELTCMTATAIINATAAISDEAAARNGLTIMKQAGLW